MLVQIPEGTPAEYGTGINLILWELVIFILFMFLPLAYLAARKQEFKNIKISELGQGWFGFFYAIARLLFILAIVIDNGNSYDDYTNIAYLFSMVGLSILIFTFEIYRLGRKAPIFTLIGVLSSFFTLSGFEGLIPGLRYVEREIILVIISVASTILLLLVANLYFKIMERFPGKTRNRTGFEFIGLLILVLGIIFDGEAFITMPTNPPFFQLIYPGILAVTGAIILISSHFLPSWAYKTICILGIIVLGYFLFLHLPDFQTYAL